MLFRLIRSRAERRAAVRQQAEALIASYGEESWSIARRRASAIFEESERRDVAWDIVAYVERRLKIDWQPDTTTRYLEGTMKRRHRAGPYQRPANG